MGLLLNKRRHEHYGGHDICIFAQHYEGVYDTHGMLFVGSGIYT